MIGQVQNERLAIELSGTCTNQPVGQTAQQVGQTAPIQIRLIRKTVTSNPTAIFHVAFVVMPSQQIERQSVWQMTRERMQLHKLRTCSQVEFVQGQHMLMLHYQVLHYT